MLMENVIVERLILIILIIMKMERVQFVEKKKQIHMKLHLRRLIVIGIIRWMIQTISLH